MRRTARHYFEQGLNSTSTPSFNISPKLSNLTLGPVPTDLSEVVVSQPQHAGITDKIHNLLDEYRAEITVIPSSGGCVDDITARCPRGFIQSLYELLKQDGRVCHRETNLMVALLEILLSKNLPTVGLTRNFWLQIHRVFEELNANEASLNLYAAAVRAMAYPISSDVQALPSTNMLLAANDVFEEHQDSTSDPIIDEEFKKKYPQYLKPQPRFGDVVSRVIKDLPSSLGLDTSKPATNVVGISPSDASSQRQLYDLDRTDTLHGQAYNGFKDLFTSTTLTVPIRDLHIITYSDGKPMINFYGWDTITVGVNPAKQYTVYTAWSQSVEDLDLNKSVLDQDWAVKGLAGTNYKSKTLDSWVNIDQYDKYFVAPTIAAGEEDTSKSFVGISGRTYTHTEVTSLATGLDALWRKISQLHLPTPQQLDAGLGILASGLGAIGTFTGCAGLVKASDIMTGVQEGLGYFLPAFNNAMGVKPDPKASIVKNAMTVLPALFEAGKATYEAMTVSTLDQRVSLGNYKSVIEQNFGRVKDVSSTSKRVALSLPV